MANITKPKTWADNENVTFTDINSNFDTIYNAFNGGIDNSNLSPSASFDVTKVAGTAVNLTNPQTISGKKTFAATSGTLTTDVDGSTITFDMNVSNLHTVTLAGNRTLALTNVQIGQAFVIRLVQDGTGSRTVSWFSTIKWPYGVVPTLTTTASKTDAFGFLCTGSGTFDGFVIGQSL